MPTARVVFLGSGMLASFGPACAPATPRPPQPGTIAAYRAEQPSTLGWPLRPAGTRHASHAGMVEVPAGEFIRGNDTQPLNRDEYPKAKVRVEAFWIDEHEVTVAEYLDCVHAGSCEGRWLATEVSVARLRENPECNAPHPERGAHPINCVSWSDAYRYCAYAGKRLPTETEWEKAARGDTDDRQAPWGALADVAKDGIPRANLADRALAQARPGLDVFASLDDGWVTTAPVGSFPLGKSPFGALDMLGNVEEWVFDWYDVDAYFQVGAPSGPEAGAFRVYRGHGWSSSPSSVRLTRRFAEPPSERGPTTGVRCALDAL